MTTLTRRGALASVALASLVALAACGSDGKGAALGITRRSSE